MVGNGLRNISGKVLKLFDFVNNVHYRLIMRADDQALNHHFLSEKNSKFKLVLVEKLVKRVICVIVVLAVAAILFA